MNIKSSYHINQLRDFSTLFSRSEVLRWLQSDFNSINLKVKRYDLQEEFKGESYLNILRYIYKILVENYPNEYIFKNEFLNKWLKSELGNSKSIIINEFRLGNAIADLAMFNGISKVFEIKTILDKEYRLSNQIKEYKKIFNEIYLIIPNICIEKYTSYDESVGIITYDLDIKNFKLFRNAKRNLQIDATLLMEFLHTNEYKEIVKIFYGELPEMNSFTQFESCKELIRKIPSEELNKLFLMVVKKRKINNKFFDKSNNEFNQICLSLNLDAIQMESLIYQLKANKI